MVLGVAQPHVLCDRSTASCNLKGNKSGGRGLFSLSCESISSNIVNFNKHHDIHGKVSLFIEMTAWKKTTRYYYKMY